MQPQSDQPTPTPTPTPAPVDDGTSVHSAGTVIAPNGAAGPSPAPTPAPAPAPAAPPAPNPGLPPVPPVSNGPVTQADFLALAKKKRRPKRILAIVLPILLVIAVVATLHFTGVFPLTRFKTVTYNNGDNSTYKLTFYAKHKVEEASSSEKDIAGAAQTLVSKTGKDGQAPIKVFIQDADAGEASSAFTGLSNCGTASPVVKVHNKAADTNVNICDIGGESDMKDYLYMGLYKDEDRVVVVVIMSAGLNEEALSSPEKAKEMLKNAKLDVYKDDIATIVSSIEIVPSK